MRNMLLLISCCLVLMTLGETKSRSLRNSKKSSEETFTLTSKKFVEGDMLPTKYTCDGKGVSPPLEWSNPPSGTVQYLLTRSNIYDTKIDAVRFDWVVYGIDGKETKIGTDGSEKIGTIGGTFPGIEYIYRSSCSEGEGMKLVTFKVHALKYDLGAKVKEGVTCNTDGEQCDVAPYIYGYARDNDWILDTAELNVYYCGGCSDEEIKDYCVNSEVAEYMKTMAACASSYSK